MKQRNAYWQIVRGCCILAVILIHCPNALNSGNKGDYNTWIAVRQIVDFPVPIFVFMAGYFANKEKCMREPKKRMIGRGGYC